MALFFWTEEHVMREFFDDYFALMRQAYGSILYLLAIRIINFPGNFLDALLDRE